MNILYKILFEVKVLHEYYLTDPQGSSIFDAGTQAARLQYLLERFDNDFSPVNEDLLFSLPPEQQALFRNYRMVLIPSYSGCLVAIAVNAAQLSDGTTVYTPALSLPDDLNIVITINETRDLISRITNARMATPVKTAFYFSNEQVFAPKVSPFLSSPVPAEISGYSYEQGELASFGPNDIRAYYYYITDWTTTPPTGGDVWFKLSQPNFTSELDRLVTSPRFFYRFSATDNVSNAVFELRDGNGQVVNTRTVSYPQRLDKVLLDYSALLGPGGLQTLPAANAGGRLLYTLNATGDNGYSRQVSLVFCQQPAADPWGWIQIKNKVNNPAFNVLDANGRLITQLKSDGTPTQHQVFEIWLKSRFTYWRYQNDEGGTLKAPASDISPMLDLVNGQLITKVPRSITYLPTYLQNPNNNSYHLLPNPDAQSLPDLAGRQSFSNIPVPDSTLFPIN